jgi:hypothetical protein
MMTECGKGVWGRCRKGLDWPFTMTYMDILSMRSMLMEDYWRYHG